MKDDPTGYADHTPKPPERGGTYWCLERRGNFGSQLHGVIKRGSVSLGMLTFESPKDFEWLRKKVEGWQD